MFDHRYGNANTQELDSRQYTMLSRFSVDKSVSDYILQKRPIIFCKRDLYSTVYRLKGIYELCLSTVLCSVVSLTRGYLHKSAIHLFKMKSPHVIVFSNDDDDEV